jgi:hypothetical protein
MRIKYVKLLAALISIVLILASCDNLLKSIGQTVDIKSDEIGLIFEPYGGGLLTDTILTHGTYKLESFNDVRIMNIGKQEKNYKIYCKTKDGFAAYVVSNFVYKTNLDSIHNLYMSYNNEHDNTFVKPLISEVIRLSVPNYTSDDLNYDSLSKELLQKLSESALNKYFEIVSFEILTIEYLDNLQD